MIDKLTRCQRHSLTVQPRKKLTSHVDFDLAHQCFSKHFDKDLSFSTTPLEVSMRGQTPVVDVQPTDIE